MLHVIGASFSRGQNRRGVEQAFRHLRPHLATVLVEPYADEELVFDGNEGHWGEKEGIYLNCLASRVYTARVRDDPLLTIGGDHTVGLSTVFGALKADGETVVLWVDAHADFNNVTTTITGALHGMPLHGLVHGGDRTFGGSPHFSWLEQGVLAPTRVTIVGLRDVDPLEIANLRRSGVRYFGLLEIQAMGIDAVVRLALDEIGADRPLHVSLDVDVIRAEDFPATGYACAGGIAFKDALRLVDVVRAGGRLRALDLVEYNPLLDTDGRCRERCLALIARAWN